MDSRPEQHIQASCNWLSRLQVYWFLGFFFIYLGCWLKDTALKWPNRNNFFFLQSTDVYKNVENSSKYSVGQCISLPKVAISNTSTWHPGCISNEAAVFMWWHIMKKTATTNLHHIRSPSQPFFASSHNTPFHKQLLRKQLTSFWCHHWFSPKMRKKCRNSTLMTCHYPDLGSASDWLCCKGNLLQPIRRTG